MQTFFTKDRDRFVPTELTRGPWSIDHQHGGPPSALLVHVASKSIASPIARATIEMLRPFPIAPLRVLCDPPEGRKVQRVQARLVDENDTVLARATFVAIRDRALEVDLVPAPKLPPPSSVPALHFSFFAWEMGYHRAVEAHVVQGAWGTTPITVWAKSLVNLVEDLPITPLEQLFVLADAESGIGPPLDVEKFTFVNPDLTVHLARMPHGEWLGMDVRSHAGDRGAGIAASVLFDERGLVGRAAQSLLVEPR